MKNLSGILLYDYLGTTTRITQLLLLTRAVRNAGRETHNGIRTASEANSLTIVLLWLISIEHLKVDSVLPECAI